MGKGCRKCCINISKQLLSQQYKQHIPGAPSAQTGLLTAQPTELTSQWQLELAAVSGSSSDMLLPPTCYKCSFTCPHYAHHSSLWFPQVSNQSFVEAQSRKQHNTTYSHGLHDIDYCFNTEITSCGHRFYFFTRKCFFQNLERDLENQNRFGWKSGGFLNTK